MFLEGKIIVMFIMFNHVKMFGDTMKQDRSPRRKSESWIKHITKWRDYEYRRQGFVGNIRDLRRARVMSSFKRIKKSKESYYDPYHWEGEWVFLRPVKPYMTTEWVPTQPTEGTPRVTNNIAMYRECNIICPEIYKSYGPVCGQRLYSFNWTYYYKDFTDICHLENENCYYEDIRPNWYPLFAGKCRLIDPSNVTTFRPFPSLEEVLSNRESWTWEVTTPSTELPTPPMPPTPPPMPSRGI